MYTELREKLNYWSPHIFLTLKKGFWKLVHEYVTSSIVLGLKSLSSLVCFQVTQLMSETPATGPKNEALPPARKEGDLPPLWWQFVTRPRERPT